MLIHELYTVCKHAVLTKLEAIGFNSLGNANYYLFKIYDAEFAGIRTTLSILDIDVHYRGERISSTSSVIEGFLNSLEQQEESFR
ncbi:hypothetical protein [Salipaludibacillus sp. CF4.18]|uniref:hypothetical protein n=1 Tax=Salipaludibacillus sp. CF4.18 TaxID=3373081 RepID=UPI003EE5BB2B